MRIRSAAPFLVSPPIPATTPPRVSAWVPPRVSVPPRLTLLARVVAVLASRVVPFDAFSAPVPMAVLEPIISEPAFSAVVPV
ncbi:hypothetical protein D3C73_1054100 [compost metagenome]